MSAMFAERRDGAERTRLPPVTRWILTLTIAVFVLQLLFDTHPYRTMSDWFGLNLHDLQRGHVWQLVTYMFLHRGFLHILLNMLVVFMFGRELERILGARRFVWLYLGSGIMGGLGWLLMSEGSYCIGASGGVFGLIGMFAALFPNRPITLLLFFLFPVTLKARTMAFGLGVVSFGLMFWGGNIAHSAHLAGGLAGYWFGYQLLRQARTGRNGRLRRSLADVVGGALRVARRRPRLEGHWNVPSDQEMDLPPTPEAIDGLLDKILTHGVGSLTYEERHTLERASAELGREGEGEGK